MTILKLKSILPRHRSCLRCAGLITTWMTQSWKRFNACWWSCIASTQTKVASLIADAKTRLDTNVGMHPYTSYLREHLDEDGRFEVICALWQLAIADDRVDKFEEHTIRKAADLLYLSHNRFIEAKLRAKSA